MKKQLHLILIGILFPLIMNAQLISRPVGKTGLQNHSRQTVSKNPSSVLFPFALSGFFREDFEGATFPPAGWQVVDVLNSFYTWEQSDLISYTGDQSAYISYDIIPVAGEDWLILPQFTVAATDSFSFWLALEYTGYPPDSTFILVSTTDSAITSFTSVVATLVEGVNYPTTVFAYQYYSYSLAAYAGQDIYVALKNKNTFGDGVLIDRASIGTKPAINATAFSIDVAKYIQTSSTVSPTATFQNDGNTMQSFPVTMTITGGYSSVKNITNLAPGGIQQITFDPWTAMATAGNQTISIQTQLAGDGYSADDSASASIKVLEPFTNYGWSSRATLSVATWGIGSTAINTNDTSYYFAMGGYTGTVFSNQAREYIPYSNSWSVLPVMPSASHRAHAAYYNNKIYVIGGYVNGTTLSAANRVYDVITNSWSLAAPLPVPLSSYALGIYHDSLFYVIGGIDSLFQLDLVQIYNAASDTWTSGTSLPVASGNSSCGIINNKIVISGGFFNGSPKSHTFIGEIDAANPALIIWNAGDDYPAGRASTLAGGASLDIASGLILFTGGTTNNQFPLTKLDATFAYDVNANQWKIGPSKITAANNLLAFTPVVDNDSLFMVSIGGYGSTFGYFVNEWLNMGPYVIPTSVDENNFSNITVTSYPNPFENDVEIKFSLSQTAIVKVVIVDVLGQETEVLCNKNMQAGNQQLKWNAAKYSKGIYFCKLFINGNHTTQKLLKY